jgi:hypothetical protein
MRRTMAIAGTAVPPIRDSASRIGDGNSSFTRGSAMTDGACS